jgi:hypothetical protein
MQDEVGLLDRVMSIGQMKEMCLADAWSMHRLSDRSECEGCKALACSQKELQIVANIQNVALLGARFAVITYFAVFPHQAALSNSLLRPSYREGAHRSSSTFFKITHEKFSF